MKYMFCFCNVRWVIVYVLYRSNFIRPAELLEFSQRLKEQRPPQRLTLDLRKNPGDRNPDIWNAAVESLKSFCVVYVKFWKSRDTMVDHVSVMWPKVEKCVGLQQFDRQGWTWMDLKVKSSVFKTQLMSFILNLRPAEWWEHGLWPQSCVQCQQ